MAQWIARVVPNYEVGRSNRLEDAMARISLVRETGCNPVVVYRVRFPGASRLMVLTVWHN